MPKKIHKNPRKYASKISSYREISFNLLKRVIHRGAYSNVVLMKTLSEPSLPPEARRNITALTYGVLRNYIFVDYVLRQYAAKKKLKVNPDVALAGRMAVYEIFFVEKVPAYAAVDEYIKLALRFGSSAEAGFLNACLRKIAETATEKILEEIDDPHERSALETSHPLWFVKKLLTDYGEEICRSILTINNVPLPLYLRVNSVRASEAEALQRLRAAGVKAESAGVPPGCIAAAPGESFPTKELDEGLVTAQDRSTQMVPFFLEPQPGDEILDLCCGAGLKSTHLAELIGDCGKVVACDLSVKKIGALRRNARRLGLHSIRAAPADLLSHPPLGNFQKILLDVPCSGTGTLRRRPEIKLRLRPEEIPRLSNLQYELLCAAARYLLTGGTLLYSTCSLLPEENEHVIQRFLKEHRKFRTQKIDIDKIFPAVGLGLRTPPIYLDRDSGIIIPPHTINACGVFIAALRKE